MLNKLSIEELHQKLINKEISVEDLVNESIKLSKKLQESCNAFDVIIDNPKVYEVYRHERGGMWMSQPIC